MNNIRVCAGTLEWNIILARCHRKMQDKKCVHLLSRCTRRPLFDKNVCLGMEKLYGLLPIYLLNICTEKSPASLTAYEQDVFFYNFN